MVVVAQWEVVLVAEVAAWFEQLVREDWKSAAQLEDAIDLLSQAGPTLGRPLVDRIAGAETHHLKELRPGSSGASEIRVLFAFDPVRRAVLLVAGDKAGDWGRWYQRNIPVAEKRYREHITELESREYE
ncbi:type II toxin-antitoxin system RelE/ParE family toxin [Streptomyces triticirhizae]|uniref:Addiction module toxin RelE n=1 Tax=Streptomyces triticirhizae TaxID=2483353 RepID=A0A3M2LY42_9ACTN|nr:type II toxin-antitoxin system RelE/ParE family toxin [Streptomyces triticirhizae]RMI42056.1 addiction module toxin RelE [Streptomyces triticirhizae]